MKTPLYAFSVALSLLFWGGVVTGSCNGLQHYAALGLDAKGGAQVNLVPADKPGDVYTGVCNVVKQKVRLCYNKRSDCTPYAVLWQPQNRLQKSFTFILCLKIDWVTPPSLPPIRGNRVASSFLNVTYFGTVKMILLVVSLEKTYRSV